VIEPYLMQLGLLMRTPRGRLLSEGGYRHLGIAVPKEQKQQLDLLSRGPGGGRGVNGPSSGRSTTAARAVVADLLRGHRRAGHRLLRQLAALPRARAHRVAAPARPGAQRLRAERGLNWVVRRCTIDYLRPPGSTRRSKSHRLR
jgi:hypothetical protein